MASMEAIVTAYQVGDKVRVMRVPPNLYTAVDRDTGQVDKETVQIFELCVGQVLRIEDFDDYGSLELLTCPPKSVPFAE